MTLPRSGSSPRPPTARSPTITLEMLTKARELGGTVEASTSAATPTRSPPTLGAHGATKVLRHRRPRRRACRASRSPRPSPAAIEGGDAPDLILFGTTYDGRDIAGRLSVKLDKPVLTNIVDLERRRRRRRRAPSRSSVAPERDAPSSPAAGPTSSSFRPKSFAAEESGGGAAAGRAARRARRRRRRCGQDHEPPRRGGHRARSSTRPPSSSPVAVASARPTSTR